MAIDKLLKVGDVMEILRLSRSKVYQLIYKGQLVPIKIDRSTRFTQDRINQFIEDSGNHQDIDIEITGSPERKE